MSKKEVVSQFNEIMSSFLVQISPLIGSSYATKFDLAVKFNSTIAIEQFMTHALPHKDQIMTRDEEYFKDKKNAGKVADNNIIMEEIERLQSIWSQFDEKSKSNVWDMFQAMFVLGEDYIKIKYSKN